MEVRIVQEEPNPEHVDADFIRISTSSDPDDDTVTLATIQRVIDKSKGRPAAQAVWNVKTLVMKQPMSIDAAVGFATRYAQRKNIGVIYTDRLSPEAPGPAEGPK